MCPMHLLLGDDVRPYGAYLLASSSLWTGVLLLVLSVSGGEQTIGGLRLQTPGFFNRVRELRARKQSLKKGTPFDAS